ncbi:MAG: hypothetical protein QNK34_13830 [Woeseiaceae bacterium]|nr:hypothetical protein [Woeseiaceae bacterium]
MKIVDPEIVSQSVEPPCANYELVVPEQLYYLQGHFPDKPILPGVVQLQWAVELASAVFTRLSNFKGIEALKFHRIIEPHTRLTLALELTEATGKLHFSFSSDDGMHSQGRLLFEL